MVHLKLLNDAECFHIFFIDYFLSSHISRKLSFDFLG